MDCSLVSYAFAHISAYHNDVIRPSINHNGIRRRYSERIRPEDSAYQNYSWPTCHRTSGASVSIVGPIGFIGLIVPHIVKRYISKDYFLMVPLTF